MTCCLFSSSSCKHSWKSRTEKFKPNTIDLLVFFISLNVLLLVVSNKYLLICLVGRKKKFEIERFQRSNCDFRKGSNHRIPDARHANHVN
ncbi:hypothetical protein ANTPLA_LOCUS2418 [Anthophora plagiata]